MGITKVLQLQSNNVDETSEESDTNSHFAQPYCLRLLCALGGAGEYRDFIRNQIQAEKNCGSSKLILIEWNS